MNNIREPDVSKSTGGAIVNAGAVIAVLLAIPCVFMGIYGAVGVITGQKLIAGGLGALWAYLAIIGTGVDDGATGRFRIIEFASIVHL